MRNACATRCNAAPAHRRSARCLWTTPAAHLGYTRVVRTSARHATYARVASTWFFAGSHPRSRCRAGRRLQLRQHEDVCADVRLAVQGHARRLRLGRGEGPRLLLREAVFPAEVPGPRPVGPGGRDQARPRRHARRARLPGRRGLPPALGWQHQRAVAHRLPGHASPDLLAHCRRRDRPHRVGLVHPCVEIKFTARPSESPCLPPRHRRDTCSMAWRCSAPDALVDFHTGTSAI